MAVASGLERVAIRKSRSRADVRRWGHHDVDAVEGQVHTSHCPKGPCTSLLYTWALKSLYRRYFKAQVYNN